MQRLLEYDERQRRAPRIVAQQPPTDQHAAVNGRLTASLSLEAHRRFGEDRDRHRGALLLKWLRDQYPHSSLRTRAAARLDDVDAALHLGDYIYEYSKDGYASALAEQLGRVSQPAGELLAGQPGQHRGVAGQQRQLQLVEPGDELGQRIRDVRLLIGRRMEDRATYTLAINDFLADGSAVLCTFGGEVWVVSGLTGDLASVRWKRFASAMPSGSGVLKSSKAT